MGKDKNKIMNKQIEQEKKMNVNVFNRKWFLSGLVLAVIVFTILVFVSTIHAVEFVEFKGEPINPANLSFKPAIAIPGTDIKMGKLFGLYADKIAFETKDAFYYLEFSKMDKTRNMKLGLTIYTDIDQGLYKNLLLIRGFEGATGFNAWLFLFSFDKNTIRLVDYVHSNDLDFFLDFSEEVGLSKRKDRNDFKDIIYLLKDRDNNEKPEISLSFAYRNFRLFAEISENGMRIDLNPELYKERFEQLKNKSKKGKQDFREYLVYGFITKTFDKDEITKILKKKDKKEKENIIWIIDNLSRISEKFHYTDEKIVLKKVNKGDK